MHTRTYSAAREGIEGSLIEIEAVSLNSLPQIQITGLPGEIVKESRDRVKACLNNLGFDIPSSRVLIHLSPAGTKKLGSHYDLGIALSVLAAEGKIGKINLCDFGFLGELTLDGRVQPVSGALSLMEALVRVHEIKSILIPKENAAEGALLKSPKIKLVANIGQVLDYLHQKIELPNCSEAEFKSLSPRNDNGPKLDQVIGQSLAKRALQIALAGRHPLLLIGPPGVGKSTLANCAADLLPPLTDSQRVENLKIYSASSRIENQSFQLESAPFRSPHHTVSANALVGGGNGLAVPGEISLAHHGILFLDEFPEFRRDALEGMREPMQSGIFAIQRVGQVMTLPARFTLIAAMNPCPCGLAGGVENRCRCAPDKKLKYRRKLSTPILDRIALMVQLFSAQNNSDPNIASQIEGENEKTLSHQSIKAGICRAHQIQYERYGEGKLNGDVEFIHELPDFNLNEESKQWAQEVYASNKQMSYRRMSQWIKVARTIADLDGRAEISSTHLAEAWSLKCFESYPI